MNNYVNCLKNQYLTDSLMSLSYGENRMTNTELERLKSELNIYKRAYRDMVLAVNDLGTPMNQTLDDIVKISKRTSAELAALDNTTDKEITR